MGWLVQATDYRKWNEPPRPRLQRNGAIYLMARPPLLCQGVSRAVLLASAKTHKKLRPRKQRTYRRSSLRGDFGFPFSSNSQFAIRNLPLRSDQRVTGVCGEALRFRNSEFPANDVRSSNQRHHFVKRVAAAHPLTAHAAIGAYDKPLGGDMLQCQSYEFGHFFGRFDLQSVVVNNANSDFLVRDLFADSFEIDGSRASRFERDDVRIDFVQHLQRRFIRLHLAEHALLGRIAPTRVTPDFGLGAQSPDGIVEHLEHKFGVDDLVDDTARCQEVDLRFLHLDDRTTGVGEILQLLVERVADRHDARRYVPVVLVLDGESDELWSDRAELDRLFGQALRGFPQFRILHLAASNGSDDFRHDPRFQVIVQDVSARKGDAAGARACESRMDMIEARHVVRRIAGPALAPNVLIE